MATQEQSATRSTTSSRTSGADWRAILLMMVNPAGVLKKRMAAVSPIWALAVSGSAFTIFFLQTGLDLFRNGRSGAFVAVMAFTGLVYGTVVVSAVAVIAWQTTRLFGGTRSIDWSIKAFALGYSPALIYAGIGLLVNVILQWNTSIAFGVTGMLWALGPMVAAIREMTEQKVALSIVVATICGGLLLFGWSLLSVGIG
jgi:hypothetical protein